MLNWIFTDLNSYFASVEQQENPALRGKPIAVVPVMAETTSCIAASKEAKPFGVKTGTMVADARKMCPGIKFVMGRHRVYVDYHNKIVEAVESCLPVTSVMSIDEMACRLRGSDQIEENAVKLAHEIKRKILDIGEVLTCSIGIAPNRWLAKIGSDMKKPDGLTIIRKVELPQRLFQLKLRDLPGIGERMEIRLSNAGIRTVEQLCNLDMKTLRQSWGSVYGEYFYRWVRGEDLDLKFGHDRTISHSHVLSPELRNPKSAKAVAMKLVQKAGYRLRKKNLWAQRMSLSIRYLDRTRWGNEVKMAECRDHLTLNEVFLHLWNPSPQKNPLKVSVVLTDLIHDEDRTLSFFENTKRQNLEKALDRINSKYDTNLIYLGDTQPAQKAAPSRIAFNRIPGFELEGDDKE